MGKLSGAPIEELFDVLLGGGFPKDGITLEEYADEWNKRVDKEGGYEVVVPPVEIKED